MSPTRRWTGVAALALIGASLGLGGVNTPVSGQEVANPFEAFGGFNLKGRANGLQVTYNVENVFPLPPPLFQASIPEALATTGSGPTSTGFGSSAYLGSVIGNLPAIVAQSKPESCTANPEGPECDMASRIPPYPLAARADHPAGPPEATQDVGAGSARVSATVAGAEAVTTLTASNIPGMLSFGSVTTSGRTGVEGGQVVSRSRAELSDVDVLFGVLHFDSVVTDLVATSDGAAAATAGTTTVSGARVLGLPATLGSDGLVVDDVTPPGGPLAPIVDPLADPLGQVGGGLGDGIAPLNTAIQDLLGQAGGSVNELLGQAGITFRVLEPISVVDGPEASITANGLVMDITYDGSGDNPLAQLLAAIPSDQLPGEGIPGFPLNTSPQALVNLMKETHVQGFALAYGTAEVVASPAFSFTARPVTRPSAGGPSLGGAGSPGTPGVPGSPGFSTPTPAVPGAGAPLATEPAAALRGAAIGALAVILTLLSSPLWAIGSRRLADNVLAAAGGSCPDGLDRPAS